MMRGPVSPDGVLAPHIENQNQPALYFSQDKLRDGGIERVTDGDPALVLIGRSVLGQLGVDIKVAGPAETNGDKQHGVWVPIEIEAYTTLGESLSTRVHDLLTSTDPGKPVVWQGRNLDFGRFANYDKLERMDHDEVQQDIDESIILLDPDTSANDTSRHRLNDDGSLSIKISPVEFELNEEHLLGDPDRLLSLLERGRAGIARHSDTLEHDPEDYLPSFLLGGVPFSPGPRYWNIRPGVEAHVMQLASSSLLDGNRIRGVGQHLDTYDGLRQVELVSTKEHDQTFDDTWVTADVYRSKEIGADTHPATNWLSMSPEARRRRHLKGVTALEALQMADGGSRNLLRKLMNSADAGALVLSRSGVQVVPYRRSLKHTARNIETTLRQRANGIDSEILESVGDSEREEVSEGLKQLVEKLRLAGDRTSTVIATKLRLQDLNSLVESGGANAIWAEQYIGQNGSLVDEELALLINLSRRGIGIATDEHGGYREFHPMGLWVKPGVAQQIEGVETGIAVFGARRPQIGEQYDSDLADFMEGLAEDAGPGKIAIIHGNGTGTMERACVNARKRGILSLGTGIDAERNGQGHVNTAADGVINMDTLYWIVRQHQLDTYTTVAVVLPGGFGTQAEIYNALTSRKLNLRNPGPMYLVGKDEPTFTRTLETIKSVSRQPGEPDSPRFWVQNTVELVEDLQEARAKIDTFRRDMPAYWERAGIPYRHVSDAYMKRVEILGKAGLEVPQIERLAVAQYAERSQKRAVASA